MRTSASGSSLFGGGRPSTANGSAEAAPTSFIGRIETADAAVTPGALLHPLHDVLEELHQAMALAVFGGRQEHLRGDDVARIESRIDLQQLREAARHQAGADQQDQRDRDLDDDERVQQAAGAGSGRVG